MAQPSFSPCARNRDFRTASEDRPERVIRADGQELAKDRCHANGSSITLSGTLELHAARNLQPYAARPAAAVPLHALGVCVRVLAEEDRQDGVQVPGRSCP